MTALIAVFPTAASAFDAAVYAPSSRLAEGRWVKVSVPSTGLYRISADQLRRWGFSDPQRVRVYGYGGNQIGNVLKADTYVDDIPEVQAAHTARGIVFYGVGPERWVTSGGYQHQESNIYSTKGYYFLSDSDEAPRAIDVQGAAPAGDAATTFTERVHYELDRFSVGEAGWLLVGESLKSTPTLRINFDTPGIEAYEGMECSIVHNSATSALLQFTINGKNVAKDASDNIAATATGSYVHGSYGTARHSKFDGIEAAEKTQLTVTYPRNAAGGAWLDYVSLTYRRRLELPATGHLAFGGSTAMSLAVPASDVTVWDVTDPLNITALRTQSSGSRLQWLNDYHGERRYAAFTDNANLPTVTFEGNVANQNIHALSNVDMVIFTLPEYRDQAQRIAAMHARHARPLSVEVLDINSVYNEFSSGTPDVSAMRRCLKMLYDRACDSIAPVRYALIMAPTTVDPRHLTAPMAAARFNTIPGWMGGSARLQFSENEAFTTDDFIAMLEDGSGNDLGFDRLCVAVGRMPFYDAAEAKSGVDKLIQYVEKSKLGNWKNSLMFVADDGDSGVHLKDTERMIAQMYSVNPDPQMLVTKVYVDAYPIKNLVAQGARDLMYRMLSEGVMWWNYSGHASNHSWTAEGMVTWTDLNNNMNHTHVPVLYAATCDFLKWDSNTVSGAELLFQERYGGTIATISATRPVYITENGYFTCAMGRALGRRNADGQMPRIGDIYRNAKNNILTNTGAHRSNMNRLRYVLMGDPAMPLAMPGNTVRLETVDGVAVNDDNQVTIKAMQQPVVAGAVYDTDGNIIADFNGTVNIVIYDAERSITTLGEREGNEKITFEQHGDKLFAGAGKVVNGRFEVKIPMPETVANNFRPATMSLYAHADSADIEAVGINNAFFVYGYDETALPDNAPPVIDTMVLNHDTFRNGDKVNISPMLIAAVSDDVGINISTAGVGRQMVATLDGNRTFTDIADYYTPYDDGTPGGVINYPLSGLAEGPHILQFRVWDTSGNSATASIDFIAATDVAPVIYDIYSDANPAHTEANFYLRHDRPDGMATVTVTVYNLLGHALWQSSIRGRSDMFLTAPVTWDLTDGAGRRVPRGIYLYRADIVTDDGESHATATRKIAVAAK